MLEYIKTLIQQPSTYIGIVSILAAIGLVAPDTAAQLGEVAPGVAQYVGQVVGGIVGLVGVFMTVSTKKL